MREGRGSFGLEFLDGGGGDPGVHAFAPDEVGRLEGAGGEELEEFFLAQGI